MNKINIGIDIDVQKLLDTRGLVQAASGGGKSHIIRKIVESVGPSVQQIVLDPEGEFVTLREKFDFALIGKGGDIPLNLKYAETLAHKILETGISCIIDLYELKHHERILFVKRFLDALVNSPKELWHPVFIYVDEAHLFCPEGSKSDSMASVIDLCTRGRKRGFAAILATQRISKLHKDAAAECLNKFIGRTGLDIDRDRAGSELGMKKADNLVLRDLEPGEFYTYGPAITNVVKKFKVLPVITTHLSAGKRIAQNPPTPKAIEKILSKLDRIPEEAERDLNSMADMRKEITRLRGELTKAQKPVTSLAPDPVELQKYKKQASDLKSDLELSDKREQQLIEYTKQMWKTFGNFCSVMNSLEQKLPAGISKNVQKLQISDTTIAKNDTSVKKIDTNRPPAIKQPPTNSAPGGNISGGALRMLKAASMYHPGPITKTRMAAISRLSHSSGSFGTYISSLKTKGYLLQNGKEYQATEDGVNAAGNIDELPTDPDQLVEMWCDIIGSGSGAARILRKLKEVYPQYVSKADLGAMVDMSSTSGSFGTYISKLKGNGLIIQDGSNYKASPELFE